MTKHREFLYDPETGKLWREAGCAHGSGYRTVLFRGRRHLEHRVAWFLHYGEWPNQQIDHINGNPSDNRIVNLRLATPSENSRNRGKPPHNTTGFKGVSRQRGRYQALIRIDDGKNKFLGSFTTPEEASAAYNRAALEHHGDFARVDL